MFQDVPTAVFFKAIFEICCFDYQEHSFYNGYIIEFKEVFCLRPNLSKDISIESFKDFYWLKEELQTFCRENGISSTGSKIEISDRIETFLRTGGIKNPIRKTKNQQDG
ncbi:SAP domain-containing protein [Peribacillus frigoritolerans]|nr:SAP domain-containing protein [Peribacillus frigoritolerans]WHX64633.1 SAP domain-containing protein [Peribacillus frigoritolerans]